jgi:hypothetical protein
MTMLYALAAEMVACIAPPTETLCGVMVIRTAMAPFPTN